MPRHCSLRATTQASQPFFPSRCARRTPKTRWIIDDLGTICIATSFDHSEQEHRVGAILSYKTSRNAGILGLLHHLGHLFVAQQKREWRPVAFCQKSRKGNRGADVFVVLKRAMQ